MFALSRTPCRTAHFERRRLAPAAVLLSLLALAACKHKEAEQPPPGASTADELGRPLVDMELPVSLRNGDQAPTDAHQLEATTEQLRLNGSVVVPLKKGEVADSDRTADGTIPKLTALLKGQSHQTIALRLQAILPYETVALVLNTAKQAGVMNAAFQVRKTGSTPKTGWLRADSYVMSSKADDLPAFQTVAPKDWETFTAKWKDITEACRAAASGNCAYADSNFAKGGSLKIELMSSGHGINIDFFQRGLTPEQQHEEEVRRNKELAQKKEQFLQGHLSHDDMVEYLLLGDPATQALFQFRYQEALSAPSALSSTIGPLCKSERCGITVTADKISPMVRVISMIGAAFPDGTPAQAFAFEMPWTKKPIPTGLPEWATRELEKSKLLDSVGH